jgi:hypothetical protein
MICLKRDLLMISGKLEPRLIEGANKVPAVMFDQEELEQQLI